MIAFLDSGFGGKTIMKDVVELMPSYDYLYLGDNFRAPYGNYSQEKIIDLSERAIEFLFSKGATIIIIACNTICVAALRHLQEKYLRAPKIKDKKILGIIHPTVEKALTATRGNIGVIGTKNTIDSKVYDVEIHKTNPRIKIFSKACPLLVPLIEENWHHKPEAKMILKKYIRPLKSTNIDNLILGCTHYPFMIDSIKKIMGKKINILSQGEIVAESLKDYLERHSEIESILSKKGKRKYLTTGSPENFGKILASILKEQNADVEHVSF